MNTEFWTESEVDDLVERLTTHLDEDAARAGTPAQPGSPDRDAAAALTDELRTAAAWAGPPADVRDMILARARAGSATVPGPAAPESPVPAAAEPVPAAPELAPAAPELAPEPATRPTAPEAQAARPVAPGRRVGWLAGRPTRWRRLAWTVPVAALAAALVTIVAIAADRAVQPDQPPVQVFAIAGSQLAPQASGEVRVSNMPSGFSIELDARGVPAAAPGSYYAAWLRGSAGVVPLGSFHLRGTGDPVRLWSGVPPDRYPEFVVTVQTEGDQLTPSQLVVMTASLAG